MNDVNLNGLTFEPFISAEEIEKVVGTLAAKIDLDYKGRNPVLLIVLNGAFIFAADLVRRLSIPVKLDFVKVSSYAGTESSGKIGEHFLWKMSLEKQDVIIVEDIVDTGHTLHYLKEKIKLQDPASVETVCLLIKPHSYHYTDVILYKGMEIPNDFVIGYGLDYDGAGRDLESIFKKKEI